MSRSFAFCPGAISSFFTVEIGKSYKTTGAKGGGFVLDKGVFSEARVEKSKENRIEIMYNGKNQKQARTTMEALRLLLSSSGIERVFVKIKQKVQIPIGYGFGASAACSLSGVMAASSALNLSLSNEEIAYCAHVAEIKMKTGLGTVSAVYNSGGAGVIVKPGGPSIAQFIQVRSMKDVAIIVCCIEPVSKEKILTSESDIARINKYGEECVYAVKNQPTLEELAKQGEYFTQKVSLASREVLKVISIFKECGAFAAAQNMIGQAVHGLVYKEDLEIVCRKITERGIPYQIYNIGKYGAKTIKSR